MHVLKTSVLVGLALLFATTCADEPTKESQPPKLSVAGNGLDIRFRPAEAVVRQENSNLGLPWDDWIEDSKCHQAPLVESVREETELRNGPLEVGGSWRADDVCELSPARDWRSAGRSSLLLRDGTLVLIGEVPFGEGLADLRVDYVSVLDSNSGSSLSCEFVANNRGVLNGIFATERAQVPIAAYDGPAHPQLGEAPVFGLWSSHFDPRERIWQQPIQDGPLALDSRLYPDGQLLTVWKSGDVSSIDSRTGEFNWVLKRKRFEELFPGLRIEVGFPTAHVSSSDGTMVIAGYEDTVPTGQVNLYELKPKFALLDSCGSVMRVDEDSVVYTSHEGVTLRSSIGVGRMEANTESLGAIEFEPRQAVETDDGTVVYLKFRDETLHIIGATSTWGFDPLAQPEFENVDGRLEILGMAAAEGGTLVLNVRQNVDAERSAWVAFVDLSDGSLLHVAELGDYEYIFDVRAVPRPPFVGNDGRVIVEQGGVVWGLPTNLSGLAKTKFPRGIAFGGNGNTPHLP